MIRKATEADIPAIVGMSERFYGTTSYAGFADFDAESVEALAGTLIDSGVMLLAEDAGQVVGMVGLAVAPFLFNHNHKAAYEVVWWVNPEARGSMAGYRLLQAVEPACREAGCSAIQMVHLANSPPQAGALYARCGYEHTETSWTKVL